MIPAKRLARFRISFQTVLICLMLALGLWSNVPVKTEAGIFSSLKGLITLKELAEQSVPYEIALKDDHPILLEFYANWCTTCQGMAPSLEVLHQRYGDEVSFVLLDIDDPKWQKPVNRFNVTGVPQIFLLSQDQQILGSWIGSVPPSILDEALVQISQIGGSPT